MSKRFRQLALLLVFLFCGFLWLTCVWPTPWQYFKSGEKNLRVNRFTGATETLTIYGWAPYAAPKPDPLGIGQ